MLPRRLLLPVLTVGALAAPTASPAAEYTVPACGTGANNSWTYASNSPLLESGGLCPADGSEYGGLYVRDILASPVDMDNGQTGYWTFTAPAGLTVTGITYTRWLYKQDDEDLKPELRTSTGAVLDTCSLGTTLTACSKGSPSSTLNEPVTFTGFSAPALNLGVRCQTAGGGTQCVGGGTVHHARAVLYQATVTVTDPLSPTVGTATGTLTADGWLRGTFAAGATAADASGISAERVLLVDGAPQEVGSIAVGCDYTYAKPCPDVTSAPAIAVNTAAIADGVHQLTVAARDAAGNETQSAPFTVQIDNGAPTAPTGLVIAEGARTSASSLHASWSNPGGQASPITTARWSLCPQQGGTCLSGETSTSSVTIDNVPEGARRLRVWLQDQAGNTDPANAAIADVIVNRTPPPPPPPPPATPPTTTSTSTGPVVPVVTKRSPGLRATRVLRGRRLTVGASLARAATGNVTFVVSARRGTKVLVRRTRSVRISKGAARFTLTLPQRARRVSVRATYRGSTVFRPASASRTLLIKS